MWNFLRFTFILTQVYLTVCSTVRPYVTFSPQKLDKILVGSVHTVNITFESNNTYLPTGVYFDMKYKVLNPMVFNVSTEHQKTSCVTTRVVHLYDFHVTGRFLGYGSMDLTLEGYDCLSGVPLKNYTTTYNYKLSVIRGYSMMQDVFTVALGLAVTINYVNMGCQLDFGAILRVLKSPVGPIIGLCCQFLIMPLGSFLYGWLLLDDLSLRLGLFALGCSPGGSLSNFWTLLFNGDLNLSVTMTFISTIAALGMMPFWFFTLGSKLFHEGKATLPYGKLATSLVYLTGPLAIGMLIRRFKPNWAELSTKIIRPFTVVTMIVVISVGIYANRYIFALFTWKIIIAGFAVAATGYTLGSLVSWLCCLPKAQMMAVAIETAFQNGGIAYIILKLSLPQPDADLTGVPVVAQLLLTGLPMWFALIVVKALSCFNSKSYSLNECEKDTKVIKTNKIEGQKATERY